MREYSAELLPQMKALWLECFEEREEYVDAFLSLLPQFGTAVVDTEGAALRAAAYIIDDIFYEAKRCALIYAVGVGKAYRRMGLGGELVRRAAALAEGRGAEHITILPAEESLYGWYAGCAGFQCRLYRREQLIEAAELAFPEPVTAVQYAALRQKLLPEGSLRYGTGAIKLQEALCRVYGGGLYLCAGSLAAAYRYKSQCIIQELLCPEGHSRELIASAIACETGAEEAVLLSPGSRGDSPYLAAAGDRLPADCYWPFAFD